MVQTRYNEFNLFQDVNTSKDEDEQDEGDGEEWTGEINTIMHRMGKEMVRENN